MSWNCNGISGKRHQLELILNQHKPDIFALTETKLTPSILDKEICCNYTLYRLDRTNSIGRGGGVLIGVSDSSNIQVNKITPALVGEILTIDVNIESFSFNIAVYYHRPIINNVDDFISWCSDYSSCRQIIVGDFNLPDIDWNTKTLKKRINPSMHNNFLKFLDTTDLEQTVNFPTNNHGNTLDLILSNLCLSTPTSEPSCSDHHILLFNLLSENPISHSSENNNSTPFWLFHKANMPELMIDCLDIETSIKLSISNNDPINQVWNSFKTGILKTANSNIPIKNRKPSSNHWITKTTKREIARRRRWHKISLIYNTHYNKERAYTQSKLCDKLINADYNSFLNKFICDKLEKGDTKPLFKFIANRRGNNNTIKKINGCKDDTALEMAECFATAFCSVFTADDGNCPQPKTNPITQLRQIEISPKGVLKQLQLLDRSKGAGPDGLSSALLKFLACYIYQSLTMIYQLSIDTGSTPVDWRRANVIPIHKKGSRSEPLNYRPISMTCIASKILEHIISSDINAFLDEHKLLADCQHGFRKRHGCDTQLLETTSDLIDSYDLNIPVDVAVLDFSKAFDVVSHQKLLTKLKAMGIHLSTCEWIHGWLSNRSLSVIVNGATSSGHKVTSGVPQGSVLGPLLFLIFINDMQNSVGNCNLKLFADDSLVYQQINSQTDAINFQSDLNNLSIWADTWQMRFNILKCEHMRIQRPNCHSIPTNYTINNTNLSEVATIKYLGVYIDKRLSFDKHIHETCKRGTRILHMLMRSLKKARTKTKTIAYNTICRPILEYASQTWSPHLVKHINLLEAINRKAFRWAHHKGRYDHISQLMLQNDWQELTKRRDNADLKLYFKIISGYAAVDQQKVSLTQSNICQTRTGAIRGSINTDTKRYTFKNRIYKLTNPMTHRLTDT